MSTKLRRHLETEKQGRQLHIINGSVYYRVTYRGRMGIGQTMIQNHLQLHSTLLRGHWDNFIVTLVYGGVGAWKQDVHS